jgi:hypothetical protein
MDSQATNMAILTLCLTHLGTFYTAASLPLFTTIELHHTCITSSIAGSGCRKFLFRCPDLPRLQSYWVTNRGCLYADKLLVLLVSQIRSRLCFLDPRIPNNCIVKRSQLGYGRTTISGGPQVLIRKTELPIRVPSIDR